MKNIFKILSVLFLFISGLTVMLSENCGVMYFIFSVVCLLMLSICFFQKQFIGPLFLSFFLFMGLWFKTTVHFLFVKEFIEPVGHFNFSFESWNEVFLVALVGMAGLTASVFLFGRKARSYSSFTNLSEKNYQKIPILFIENRILIYTLSFLISAFISFLNLKWGVHQIGLIPKTILPWPMNSVISYLINLGLILFFSLFIFWDIKLKKNIILGFSLICFTAFFTSLSALSRGMFVIQMLPYFISLILISTKEIKKYVPVFFLFVSLFVVSIMLSNVLRNQYYPDVTKVMSERQKSLIRLEVLNGGIENVKTLIEKGESSQSEHLQSLILEKNNILNQLAGSAQEPVDKVDSNNTSTSTQLPLAQMQTNGSDNKKSSRINFLIKSNVFKDIYSLILNRFIGIEGLMAMQSFPNKNIALIFQALLEKRSLTTITMYQEVARSTYRYTDMNVWQFATLPGAIAFLYYSGSLAIVFSGMFIFGFILITSEILISKISDRNIFLISLLMSIAANAIAQFGVTPRQDLPFYGLVVVNLVFYWGVVRLLKRVENSDSQSTSHVV